MRPFIRWATKRARHGAARREGAKSALVARLEPLRTIFMEVGRRMHALGFLDAADDIFFLTWPEIDAFMRSWWDGRGARTLVKDRKAQRDVWLLEEPPDVIFIDADGHIQSGDDVSAVSVNAAVQKGPDPTKLSGERLAGTGVAAGIATGRVRILRHPNEGHRLGPGEILVAPSTDPGWTPLFMPAAAVVMEVGGFHSHGAIVAREFGIPAVANIPGLLTTLRDGEVVTVDGDAGVIIRTAL